MSLNIEGLDRAELLAALHNGTRALGLGALHDLGRPMTREEAQREIDARALPNGDVRFDYVQGRPIKVAFRGGELLHERLFDRDAPGGDGSCSRIIEKLREHQVDDPNGAIGGAA